MREKATTLLGVLMLGLLSPIADLCGVEFPKWLRFGLFHAFVVALVFVFLAIAVSYTDKPLPRLKGFSARQSTVFVIIAGAIIGAIMAPLVWNAIRPDDIDIAQAITPDGGEPKTDADEVTEPTVAVDRSALVLSKRAGPTMVSVSPLIPDPKQKPANPTDLEFYFFSLSAAAFDDKIQYATVTATNRSPRRMHLELWGQIDYWKDNGETGRTGLRAEWNPDGLREGTGQTSIDFEPFETKNGRLALFLGEPDKRELNRWFLDPSENVYIEVFDTVTGKRIAFKGRDGYPKGQMPSPLPSRKELLALDFPQAATTAAQDGPIPESLSLLLRTRDQGYNGTKFSISALFRNLSSEPMELEVSLLIRNTAVDNTWMRNEGLLEASDDEGSTSGRTLSIEPGDTLVRDLKFDLAAIGVPSTGGWSLRRQPKDTLLEITDRKSGRTVWCALLPGFPPGADMRSANIMESPQANSDNLPADESKDNE